MDIQVGAFMLQNELNLLKIIVALGFLGWMMLMFVQVVLLDKFTSLNKSSQKHSVNRLEKKEFLKAA